MKPLVPKILVTLPGRTNATSEIHSESQDGVGDLSSSFRAEEKSRDTDQTPTWASDAQLGSNLRPSHGRVYQQPAQQESAAELWQRAIRLEAEQRKGSSLHSGARSSDRSRLSPRPSGQATPSHTQIHLNPNGSTHRSHDTSSYSQEGPRLSYLPLAAPTCCKDTGFSQRLPKQPRKLAMPPKSWARYPAHTRESRNAQASANDNVISKDFAIRSVSSDGQFQWVTNKPASMGTHWLSPRSASLPGRLGRAFKVGMVKLFTVKGNFDDAKEKIFGRQHPNLVLAGDVEYTELGVLPPGIGHLLEPEQIAEISNRRSEALSSRQSFVASLKIAQKHQSSSNSVAHDPRSRAKQYRNYTAAVIESSWGSRAQSHMPRLKSHLTPTTEALVPLNTNPNSKYKDERKPQKFRLSAAKSEQVLSPHQSGPGIGQGKDRPRSLT